MQSKPSSGIKLTAYSYICWLFRRIYYDAHFAFFAQEKMRLILFLCKINPKTIIGIILVIFFFLLVNHIRIFLTATSYVTLFTEYQTGNKTKKNQIGRAYSMKLFGDFIEPQPKCSRISKKFNLFRLDNFFFNFGNKIQMIFLRNFGRHKI